MHGIEFLITIAGDTMDIRLPNLRNPFASRMQWPILAAALCLLLGGSLVETAVDRERAFQDTEQARNTVTAAARVRAAIESDLNASLHLAMGLAAYIKSANGLVHGKELDAFLSGLFSHGHHIRNIGIAPNNRISHVYPLAGNEKALGLHYPDMPAQWPAVERAIRERRPNLAGPLPLVQGGLGLIYRVPVFLADGDYWGIVSMVINADQMLRSALPVLPDHQFALRGKDGLGERGDVIWGDGGLFSGNAVLMDVAVPGGRWQMAVRPKGGLPANDYVALMRIGGWMSALIIAAMAFLAASSRRHAGHIAASLRRSEDRYRETFDALNDGMWEWDLTADSITWDPRCYRILGYEPCYTSMSRDTWLHRIHPLDAPVVLAAVEENIRQGERFETEYRLRTRDNRWLWIAMRGRVVSWEGSRPRRVAGTLSDISVRKEAELALRASEHRVRTLIDAMTDLVFVIDTTGRFSEFHPPADERDRYPPPEHFIGRHYEEVLPPDAALSVREALTGLFVDGRPRFTPISFPSDAGARPLMATFTRLGEDAEWPLGFLCVARRGAASA